MSLHLFNTLSKKEEEFVPLEKGKVKMYTCGPTVYGRPHIGNHSSFLMADLLRRWLEVSGYKVTHAKNITDVGHLVADANADAGGEDKVERQAKAENVDPLTIAKKYTEQYLEDEAALNMIEPEFRPKATETIAEMIAIIQKLIEKGGAYETEDGIYFSVWSFTDYGKLSGNTLDKLGKLQPSPRFAELRPASQPSPRLRPAGEEGVRVELKESKKHPADFALWKKCVGENAEHILRWSFPSGERVTTEGEDHEAGFPGWHIECSAMSQKHLGDQLDIHTGGEDNIFPHHECEIAQSEGASLAGKPFVKYWLHKRRVNFASEKMSKSLGNVLSLPDIIERGFSALDLRYFFLSSHYRSHTQFTWKGLEDAKKARVKIVEWIEECGTSVSDVQAGTGDFDIQKFQERFTDAMNNDLNTPEALAVVFDCMAWSRQEVSGIRYQVSELHKFVEMVEKTFGCFQSESVEVPDDIQKLVDDRETARKAGDYATSDKLRDEVQKRGFVLEDLPKGVKVVPEGRRG